MFVACGVGALVVAGVCDGDGGGGCEGAVGVAGGDGDGFFAFLGVVVDGGEFECCGLRWWCRGV